MKMVLKGTGFRGAKGRSALLGWAARWEGVRFGHHHVPPNPNAHPPLPAACPDQGAFIRFNGNDMVPHFTTFDAVKHPDVKPMAFANSFLWGM